jgi:hypothetical protein
MLDNTMGQNDGYVDIDLAAVLNPAPLGSGTQVVHKVIMVRDPPMVLAGKLLRMAVNFPI